MRNAVGDAGHASATVFRGERRGPATRRAAAAPRPVVDLVARGAAGGERVTLVAAVNDAGRARGLSANDVLREAAAAVDGKGGGKDDVAQGGGSDPTRVDEALALVATEVARQVDAR